jgi:hypothetical protein
MVSLIGAAVLYWMTVGAVRGFALFLGLATLLDLVVSWFFMRPAVVLLGRWKRVQAHPGLLALTPPDEPADDASGAPRPVGAS